MHTAVHVQYMYPELEYRDPIRYRAHGATGATARARVCVHASLALARRRRGLPDGQGGAAASAPPLAATHVY
jgi:hypothetical protein